MEIQFVDLKQQYLDHQAEIDEAIRRVILECQFIRGRYVEQFEKAFASANHMRNCVSLANGTDALFITLKMLGIGLGDEVITTANTWIASSETITLAGARPVFVDVDPNTYNLDASKIEAAVTPRTKAIIPVHLYGQMADMDTILALASRLHLQVVEDCAQAHFATFNNRLAGTFGVAAAFSFYPGKNLGAYGDAGCVLTNDDTLASKVRMFANHGSLKKHEHEIEGMNSRMDGLQASILLAKLPYIHTWNQQRTANAHLYTSKLVKIPQVTPPLIHPQCGHVFHVYCIRCENRDGLKAHLASRNIPTMTHYPRPLPFTKAYEYLGHTPADFPVAYRYHKEILSLPMCPELTEEQIDYIVQSIESFYRGT